MQQEFIGHKDKHGHKLYVGDRVQADNGVIGRVVSYDYVEEDIKGNVTHTKRYRVNWSPSGRINDSFSENSFIAPDMYITKVKKGK